MSGYRGWAAAALLASALSAGVGHADSPTASAGADVRWTGEDAAAGDLGQVVQLRKVGEDPATIEDKLFVLWEYAGALRERELAKLVSGKTADPEIRALAILVRDGHQAGMDIMVPIAGELGIVLPKGPTAIDLAAIEAAGALSPSDLDQFFLRRQRAMHAWDITVFDDYGAAAKNQRLQRYIAATRQPLRDHAQTVVRLANQRGIPGGLNTIGADEP